MENPQLEQEKIKVKWESERFWKIRLKAGELESLMNAKSLSSGLKCLESFSLITY